jgi:protein associated with RNAse G/E
MAIPHLYRIVPLEMRHLDIDDWERKEDPMLFAHSLSSRLLDTKNEQLRNAVHELDFGRFNNEHVNDMEKRLVTLIDVLPNLQRVK